MARDIRGMVCVITGASSGIGAALAIALGKSGAKLALAARRADKLESVNSQAGGGHLCLRADVGQEEDCRGIVERTEERFGRIDTLVCNAGFGIVDAVDRTSAGQFQRIFQVNVFGTADCIRAAAPAMRRQEIRDGWRGQIVVVSSGLARRGAPTAGAYSATKAAQLSIAESLRVTLAPDRIAVTSVHPVLTETEFFTSAERQGGRKIPPRSRWEFYQQPQQVARAIVRAIRHPRPEVWPYGPARWAAIAGIIFPRLGDWVMSQHRKSLLGD